MEEAAARSAHELEEETRSAAYGWAEATGCLQQCYLVARYLGASDGRTYRWRCGTLDAPETEIYLDEQADYLVVLHNGVKVCSTHPAERLFVAGDWIDQVHQVFPVAEGVVEELRRQKLSKQLKYAERLFLP